MPKRLKRYCWHISAFSIKISAFLCVLFLVLVTLFVLRVSKTPLDISFAKEYIQYAMNDAETGNSAVFEHAYLYWPDLKGPLFLQIKEGQLMNKEGIPLLTIDTASLSFSRAGLIGGRILPKAIILEKPVLRMSRDEEGALGFNMGGAIASEAKDDQTEFTTRIFGYIARPGQENANKSTISKLQSFKIEEAQLIVEDRAANQTWSFPNFNIHLFSTYTGMEGKVSVDLPNAGLEAATLQIEMNYLWDQKDVELSAYLNNIGIQTLAQQVPQLEMLAEQDIVLDAKVETILDENFIPSDLRVSIESERGSILHPDLSENAVPYEKLALNATYNYAGKTLSLKDTEVTLGGVRVQGSADVTHTQDGARGPVKVRIDEVQQVQIKPLWPKVLRGDNSEKWVVHRMSEGVFKDVWLNFDLVAEKGISVEGGSATWDVDVDALEAGFNVENMSVDYRSPLDTASNIYGSGRFDLGKDELSIDIKKGKIGVMPVSKASLVFDNVVAVGEGGVDINVSLHGGVADVMRFISKEPIDMGDDIDMDITKVKGKADLDIHLNFPTREDVKLSDFKIGVKGTLQDILLPDILDNLDLSGGPYEFAVQKGLASMKGKGFLENRPVAIEWSEYLESKGKPYKEKVKAKITADPNLRTMLGIDLSDFLEGSVDVDVDYISYRDGRAVAKVDADASAALFFVDPFDYEKPSGQKATARLEAHFKNGVLHEINKLTAQGAVFQLFESKVFFTQKDGKTELASGAISKFVLEDTRGKVDFAYDDNGHVKIVLDAEELDVQPFMDAEEVTGEYAEPPMKISVTANILRTAPKETLTDAKIYMDIDGQGRFNQMEMDANVGKGGVFVRFNPDKEGKRTFRMKTDDAGALLKAVQVYQGIRGGKMVIYGEPVRGVQDRNLKGKAEITDFRVVDAPALTKLLGILSLSGIGEVLAGEGLNFSKLETDFDWVYRKGGSLLVLKDGRTSGNSLGLLFDGTFDNKKREVDVSGTVVPMSGLNEIIGAIPLVGDILTGGSGGIFAATYSVKGTSENPKISVNPLSVIAPGIVRRVLFE